MKTRIISKTQFHRKMEKWRRLSYDFEADAVLFREAGKPVSADKAQHIADKIRDAAIFMEAK